jgi:hypothetical protein
MAGNASRDCVREYANRTVTEKQERVQAKIFECGSSINNGE